MANFAKVTNNIVEQVIVIADSDCAGGSLPESELAGQEFIASLGYTGEWKQTSYNNNFRGTYAGIGYTWNGTDFVPPVVEPE